MKRLALLFTSLCLCFGSLAAQKSVALETTIYNELNSAWTSRFYPGVVEKAFELEKNYPQSSLIIDGNCKKSEALYYMEQYDSAIKELEKLLPLVKNDSQLNARVHYFLARSYEGIQDYRNSLLNYVEAVKISSAKKIVPYYQQSIYKAGLVYFNIGEYQNAITNLEYVIRNGNEYSAIDFNEAIQKLFVSYNNTKHYKKTTALFAQLKKDDFPSEVYYTLCIYNADAHRALNENKQAYDSYCLVVESGHTDLAIVALKKSYVLAGEKKIGVNPADVFSKATETFSQEPGLVREFWIRLGIDEYNKKNYKAAENYLDNALKVEGNNSKEAAMITLYQAKIKVDGNKDFAAAETLLQNSTAYLETDKYKVSDSWYSTLLSCKVNLGKYNQVEQIYSKIAKPGVAEKYQLSSYLYNKKDYKKILATLKEIVEADKACKYPLCGRLYATALLKENQISKACGIYERLYRNSLLLPMDKLEYSKGLFISRAYSKAKDIALESRTVEGFYVAGLCYVNLKEWKKANDNFIAYIKDKAKVTEFNVLAYFYKGYCEYCLEDYKNAYSSFVRFTTDGKTAAYKYVTEAYDLSSKAALQYGDYTQASNQIENLIKISMSENEKQEAVIYLCDIYCDAKKYGKAISLLEPYVNAKNDFTMTALFKQAQVYEKQDNLTSADMIYEKIYTEYPKGEFAQEAMYRSGELFYSHEDYAGAQKRFNKYIYKYIDGKYFDAALFFCGDCDLKLGRYDECVMLNTNLLSKYPDGSYVYGANKNLLSAYYEQENFIKALEVARLLVKKYPEQAALDGVGSKLVQLEKIVSGTDRSVAEKLNEYEKAGKAGTYKGRKVGTELVALYANNEATMDDAVILAQELLASHSEESKDELILAAKNAEFLGDYCSHRNRYKQAGKYYLDAAQYYRGCNESEKAATCLYTAADSYIGAEQTGDAKEVIALLQRLYPESKQAKAAARLLK